MAERVLPWWTPQMTGRELEGLSAVLDSNYLNDGEVTAAFERALCERVKARHAVAVPSGTAAIAAALAAVGVGHGDEVVVPDLTFIATANAVRWAGGTPVLADIDAATLNLDPQAFRRAITPRTRAVVPVHVTGRPADMCAITTIAREHGIAVVEDAAEGLMCRHGERYLGTVGDAGCVSFSPNKLITTGQGGAVFTDDPQIHARLVELKDQGRPVRGTGGDDVHASVGWNLKFTNMQAAVGLAQLGDLDRRIDAMRRIYAVYAGGLANLPGIRLPGFDLEAGEVPQWIDAVCDDRDGLDRELAAQGIQCRRFWHPLHTQAPYRGDDASFPAASATAPRCLWLPSAFTMSDDDVRRVCRAIAAFGRGG